MNKIIITTAVVTLAFATLAQERGRMQANPEAKLHRFSTTVEKERPQLSRLPPRSVRREPCCAAQAGHGY